VSSARFLPPVLSCYRAPSHEGALSVALELPGAKDTARWMMAAMEGH
jgi:hypothetical protein